MFLGYPDGVKGYRLWGRTKPGVYVIVSRNVIFNKEDVLYLKNNNAYTEYHKNHSNKSRFKFDKDQFEFKVELPRTELLSQKDHILEGPRSTDLAHDETHEEFEEAKPEEDNPVTSYQLTRDRQKKSINHQRDLDILI